MWAFESFESLASRAYHVVATYALATHWAEKTTALSILLSSVNIYHKISLFGILLQITLNSFVPS